MASRTKLIIVGRTFLNILLLKPIPSSLLDEQCVCPSMLGFDYFESHEKKLSFSLRIVIVGKSILYSNLQYAALASSTARLR